MYLYNMFDIKLVDKILAEPEGGAHTAPDFMAKAISQCISNNVEHLVRISNKKLVKQRIKKYSNLGQQFILTGL